MIEDQIQCEVNVDFLTEDLIFSLSSSFFLHIMYMRSQIPLPFAQLKSSHESILSIPPNEEPKVNKLLRSCSFKKQSKTVGGVDTMLSALSHISSLIAENLTMSIEDNQPIGTFCILIGPSANNPKETYFLDFVLSSKCGNITSQQNLTLKSPMMTKIKRKFMHQLISHNWDYRFNPPRNTNTFFAVKLKSSALQVTTERSTEHVNCIHNCFSYRENFKVRVRTKPPFPLRVTLSVEERESPCTTTLTSTATDVEKVSEKQQHSGPSELSSSMAYTNIDEISSIVPSSHQLSIAHTDPHSSREAVVSIHHDVKSPLPQMRRSQRVVENVERNHQDEHCIEPTAADMLKDAEPVQSHEPRCSKRLEEIQELSEIPIYWKDNDDEDTRAVPSDFRDEAGDEDIHTVMTCKEEETTHGDLATKSIRPSNGITLHASPHGTPRGDVDQVEERFSQTGVMQVQDRGFLWMVTRKGIKSLREAAGLSA